MSTHQCIMSSTLFKPCSCPKERSRPRCSAQRPFPSAMTATWFSGEPRPNERKTAGKPRPKRPPRKSGTETTAEVLYCQMFSFGIPKECEKWHLNRLLTLIRVCQESQAPAKKMSKGDRMAQQRMLNEQRKARLKTRG